MYRTHTCNDLRTTDEGKEGTLAGWVHRRRDHGGLIFIDLRDRYGITQVVFDPRAGQAAHETASTLRAEFVIQVTGKVRLRPSGMENKNHSTGNIEVLGHAITILNPSKTPPFEIDQDKEINEEMRLQYRYLDLRRERMRNNIVMRHRIIKKIRDLMDAADFIEVETPMLIKGTPEGSREYLVPSRLYPGKFYVLPQSPQQLKQLLMVAGMDRYFQIARCFRDEDQRGDRQPEFTQLDVEMSFVEEEDVMKINEHVMTALIEKVAPHKKLLFTPFKRLTWHDAMGLYGSDKPDLRFEMQMKDFTDTVRKSQCQVFTKALGQEDGVVKGLTVEGGAAFSRKEIDQLTELAKIHGAKGLAYATIEKGEFVSPLKKFFTEKEVAAITKHAEAKEGDIIFFTADTFDVACTALGQVRLACADKKKLRDPEVFAFAWITDFPLFEFSKEDKKLVSAHHPFTAPKEEDRGLLGTNPRKVRAKAYDLTLNGSEVAGGSIRIHNPELQSQIFSILGITPQEATHRFGHMLEAFTYGAPPHGGIAWGLDRLVMIIQNEPNIREIIAFPKDQRAKDVMMGAPSEIPEAQVAEANVKVLVPKK